MPKPTSVEGLRDALRASEARLRHLVEHAQDLIYYCDTSGRFTYVNPAAARVMKYAEAELVGRHFITLIREDFQDAAAELYLRQLRDRLPNTYFEFPVITKDGETIWVGQHVQLVFEGDATVAVHAIARDITRQRALEEQLRQAQKMEAVGRLARGVAHDFNNVLAAIMGYAELILKRVTPDSPVAEDAAEIIEAAERGTTLTRQLLAFSRSQALAPKIIDLHAAVQGAEGMLRRLAGESVSLDIAVQGRSPRVKVEPGHVDRILINLLVNARDAMPQGGRIWLTVDEIGVGEHRPVEHVALAAGSYARIRVRDTGTGIDPDAIPHIFEPFFTTKDPSKGSGLGLAIVYGIAKDAGGAVAFSTATGKGTTFEVLLPLVEAGLPLNA